MTNKLKTVDICNIHNTMISDLHPLPPSLSFPKVDWSLMKFVNEIIRSLGAFMRKTGALLGTTFVLSLYTVFHNVICNWRNRAVQFLSIIVLGCPLQPCPAHVYNTCTVDPFRVYFHEFYEYSSKPKGFAMSWTVVPLSPFILAIRANSKVLRGSILTIGRLVSYRRQEIRRDLREFPSRFSTNHQHYQKLSALAGNRTYRLPLSLASFSPVKIPRFFFPRGASWLQGTAGITRPMR